MIRFESQIFRLLIIAAILLIFAVVGMAQRTEVTLTVGEQFFDGLLDATFRYYEPPEFTIAGNTYGDDKESATAANGFSFLSYGGPRSAEAADPCGRLKILRESSGIRTAIRFRDGKIVVPLAFSGNYAPPFVGCVEFSGYAESVVDLEFDQTSQRLIGYVRVQNVNLDGTGGLGGTLIAKMLQGSIDKKFNPIEVLSLDKLTFGLPIPNTGRITMKAVGVRPEITAGAMAIHVDYEFQKG